MKLSVSTIFDCHAERVWEELQRPRVMRHVAWPVLTFAWSAPAAPDVWDQPRHRVRLWFLGLLPLWRQWINVSFPRPEDHVNGVWRVRDDGSGSFLRRWDHLITVERHADGRSNYRDEVDIDAGLLTPLIWAFGWAFYRHRQWRWARLVASGFANR